VAATPTRTIPMLDLRAQHRTIRAEVLAAVERVIDSQMFVLGPEVAELECELASYCHTPHAIGCASGTDALILALRALDIGPGDEVITTPFSFYATASCITLVGARPVFSDILADTFNLDPAALAETLHRHPRIKAVLPVHLFGACADMDPILALVSSRGIPVIEDAAQAIGAEYQGRRAGSMGTIGCFSFFPTKNLGGGGDGGLLTTNDATLAERLCALRVHGSRQRYFHEEIGLNSRLDALQAAILRAKLPHLDRWTALRQSHAARYCELLQDLPIQTPVIPPHSTRHVFNQYTIRSPRRDELKAHLAAGGIQTETYYPLPLHLQRCFADLGYREGDFPMAEAAARDCLSLPVYPELAPEDLEAVVQAIRSFHYE
jgi:dTDP-4-amino-4,6-dideoxygalactose transaminase